ncbi:MAG TPA: GNAT family N-acetyltransferase [Pedococcus sp.]|nr:GNAT family N-acetyltransferase [Pedococcus sp.]
MPVRLRPLDLSDATALGAMHHQAWVDTYSDVLPNGYFDRWTVQDAVENWARILGETDLPGTVRLVAVEGSVVAGFAVAGPTRELARRPRRARQRELRAIYVARAHLGTGLGQRLLDGVVTAAEPLELWVFEHNARARAFYARNGFTPDGATFVDERFPDLPEVRMVR